MEGTIKVKAVHNKSWHIIQFEDNTQKYLLHQNYFCQNPTLKVGDQVMFTESLNVVQGYKFFREIKKVVQGTDESQNE